MPAPGAGVASLALPGRLQRAAELDAGEDCAIHKEERLDLLAGAHCYGGVAMHPATPSTLKISPAANLGRDGRVGSVVDDEDLVGARARGLGWGPGWGPG
eukprot:scaffold95855_cov36-Phaeocystis_antarctica.AAC.2